MKSLKLIASGFLVAGMCFATSAQAQVETFTVDMNNKRFQGQNQVIQLRTELNRAYRGWNFSDANLVSVRFFAKSRNGNGQVELRIAQSPRDRSGVPGRPARFASNNPNTYHAIQLNSAGVDRGTWQLILDGLIKVQKIEFRIRNADGPAQPPSSGWVNIGTGSTVKFFPTTRNFRVNENNVDAIEIEARNNILVIADVVVEFDNGTRQVMTDFEGSLFAGQSKTVGMNGRNVRRISVTALTPIPFGADATYRIRAKLR